MDLNADHVEITISPDGRVWVNTAFGCRVRIYAKRLTVIDHRTKTVEAQQP